uniref:Uncharacterized protein n=1 Tax=Lotus japonicus TaxID=34305 RepID=I3SYD8_LOTJA|nr:unknown [Lotus japonicus]
MAEIDDVATTRSAPASFAAFRTFTVPFIAGSNICFSGSVTSPMTLGQARCMTPLQPFTVVAMELVSRRSISKRRRRPLAPSIASRCLVSFSSLRSWTVAWTV